MSPTVLRYDGYRFFFFSREEPRTHIHVSCADGEVKFWLAPTVELAENFGLNTKQITEIRHIIDERRDEFLRAWNRHFAT